MIGERSRLRNTLAEVEVPAKASFYCLIGKKVGLDVHTFFHMGFIDASGEAVPLLEVGKVGDLGLRFQDKAFGILCNALFSKTGALIRNEQHLLRKRCHSDLSFDITYSAYQVTRRQYLYFLGLLKDINRQQLDFFESEMDKLIEKEGGLGIYESHEYRAKFYNLFFPYGQLNAFQPIKDSQRFQCKEIALWDTGPSFDQGIINSQSLRASEQAQSLSYSNTCRHTGVDFLMAVLGGNHSLYPPAVSTNFINQLPCFTSMKDGRYTNNLYLLPLPPSAYGLENEQHKILSTVYLRMETMLLKNSLHANTQPKFKVLQTMYEQLLDKREAKVNFLDVIAKHAQQEKNQQIIGQHRGWHWPFFHSTRTNDMFELFNNERKTQYNLIPTL